MKMSSYGNGAPWQGADEIVVRRGATTVKYSISALFTSPQIVNDATITKSAAGGMGPIASLVNSGGGVGDAGELLFWSNGSQRAALGFIVEGAPFGGAVLVLTGSPGAIAERARWDQAGKLGLGCTPTALLELASDSAKKPSTNTWTISSDERLKQDITAADPARCLEIVKGLPLKRFTWRDTVYSHTLVPDRAKLGWIAQDVQRFFPKAVEQGVFRMQPVEDGIEEFTEPVFEEREELAVEVVDGVPTLKTRRVPSAVVDMMPIVDEVSGEPVMVERKLEDGQVVSEPAMHPVPRMRTCTRPKVRVDTIDDCLSLNADQIYAVMYGALQALIAQNEDLKHRVATLELNKR